MEKHHWKVYVYTGCLTECVHCDQSVVWYLFFKWKQVVASLLLELCVKHPLFRRGCQRGHLDIFYKWPFVFYTLNTTALYWRCTHSVWVAWAEMESGGIWFTWRKASTLISHSRAAWPEPWQQSLRHIFLPTGDCPYVWHGELSLLAHDWHITTSNLFLSKG